MTLSISHSQDSAWALLSCYLHSDLFAYQLLKSIFEYVLSTPTTDTTKQVNISIFFCSVVFFGVINKSINFGLSAKHVRISVEPSFSFRFMKPVLPAHSTPHNYSSSCHFYRSFLFRLEINGIIFDNSHAFRTEYLSMQATDTPRSCSVEVNLPTHGIRAQRDTAKFASLPKEKKQRKTILKIDFVPSRKYDKGSPITWKRENEEADVKHTAMMMTTTTTASTTKANGREERML